MHKATEPQEAKEALPKAYDPLLVETALYEAWETSGAFAPSQSDAAPFVISLPPPNATGTLHLGHAVMLALQDIMVRYHRLQGQPTLWVPGTDHAAIATQNVVEKNIWKEEKKTRHDIGRDELIRRIDAFVVDAQTTIRTQMRRMGASLDWTHERFTLDDGLSRCVSLVFKTMYDDGLIYRGNRIVNWCTRCQTTLADDEVNYKEETTPFYNFTFGPFSIGTVRPETKLGDKYVVVRPADQRYTQFHGTTHTIPWISGDIEMTVIADEAADPTMGSGAMTITPQHSFTDFDIATRHKLPVGANLIGMDGKLTAAAGEFAGLNVEEARKKFVAVLQAKGLVEKVDEKYVHNVSVCYRCATPIEPLISKQWFVNVNKPLTRLGGKTLRERAAEAVTNGEIHMVPERFEKIYRHWMDNLHDWCISRQIWYGHRIPVWYKVANGEEPIANSDSKGMQDEKDQQQEIYVGTTPPTSGTWTQDPDTLDTWFSSGMWTFSTLLNTKSTAETFEAWRNDSPDLKRFHPTSVLETGYDIIFFWVARMILMTTYVMNEVPFKTVYLHGLVRDRDGRKMSKSLGNGIDPIAMIDKYGADALRLSMLVGTTAGNDFRLYEEKIAGYRNFVNKLWNISRFILTTTEETDNAPTPSTLADHWILSEFASTRNAVTEHIEAFRFSAAAETLYEFTWAKLADWYLEVAKVEGKKDAILRAILKDLLILWHPFTPFVTEHLWGKLNLASGMLITARWPLERPTANETAVSNFRLLQTVITAARDIRQELGNTTAIEIFISSPKSAVLTSAQGIIKHLARVELTVADALPDEATVRRSVDGAILGAIPTERVTTSRAEERDELTAYITALEARLTNEEFRSRAPAAIVEKEDQRLRDAKERLRALTV